MFFMCAFPLHLIPSDLVSPSVLGGWFKLVFISRTTECACRD